MNNINPVRSVEQMDSISKLNAEINVIQNYTLSLVDMEKRQAEKTSSDMIFGIVLERLRVERGFTFIELEKELGFSRGNIHNTTTGMGLQNLGRLMIYADFFGVTADYMLRGNDQDRETLLNRIKELEAEKLKDEFETVNRISFLTFLEDENKKLKEQLAEVGQC